MTIKGARTISEYKEIQKTAYRNGLMIVLSVDLLHGKWTELHTSKSLIKQVIPSSYHLMRLNKAT